MALFFPFPVHVIELSHTIAVLCRTVRSVQVKGLLLSTFLKMFDQDQQQNPIRRSRSPIRGENLRRSRSNPPSVEINNTSIRYKFVAGKRLNSKMLHTIDEQQMYRLRVTHKNVAQYNCYIDKCNAKLYLNLETQECSRKAVYELHNHGPNDIINDIQLNDSIKRRCRSAAAAGGSGNVRNLFHSTIRELVFFLLNIPGWFVLLETNKK